MKVGIITFHRANNFGAVLQCYALQATLKALGYDVSVIDYRQPFTEISYSPYRPDIVKKGLTAPRLLGGYLLKVFPVLFKRETKYNRFRSRYLNCTKPVRNADEMPQDFDVYLIGSDQMWSLHPTNNVIEPIFFGDFPRPNGSRLDGYAISSNIKSLHDIGETYLKDAANRFDRLSFRERIVRDEVERMTGAHGDVVLDPTLLLNYDDWDRLTTRPPVKEPYLLTYFLSDDTDNDAFRTKVKAFAEKNGLKMVDVFKIAYSPIEFLNAVKYAKVVFAASFHATALSLLLRKNFYSFRSTDGRDIRYINLLNAIQMSDRLISTDDLDGLRLTDADYSDSERLLNSLRADSIKYLQSL